MNPTVIVLFVKYGTYVSTWCSNITNIDYSIALSPWMTTDILQCIAKRHNQKISNNETVQRLASALTSTYTILSQVMVRSVCSARDSG